MRFTDLKITEPAERQVKKEQGGTHAEEIETSTHAEEIETSMMLYIDPKSVDMSKAAKDFHERRPGGLTRDPNGKGIYSPTGIWGDATLATREKGRIVTEYLVEAIVREIEELRKESLPK